MVDTSSPPPPLPPLPPPPPPLLPQEQEQEQQQQSRSNHHHQQDRRRKRQRRRPGCSRPRVVFHVDGIRAVAPPEKAHGKITAAEEAVETSAEANTDTITAASSAAPQNGSHNNPPSSENSSNRISSLPVRVPTVLLTKIEPTMNIVEEKKSSNQTTTTTTTAIMSDDVPREKNNIDRNSSSSNSNNDDDKEYRHQHNNNQQPKYQHQHPLSPAVFDDGGGDDDDDDDDDNYFDSSDDDEFMTSSSSSPKRRRRNKKKAKMIIEKKQPKQPWWMKAEPNELEHWVMNRLDKLVIRAEEKEEEKNIMDLYDKKIAAAEERDVMEQLLQKIQLAEDIDYVESTPNRIIMIDNNNKTETKTDRGEEEVARKGWNIRKRKNSTMQEGETTKTRKTKVVGVEEIKLKSIRQALPKWIPTKSGTYNDNEILFTRDDFRYCVIEPVSNQLPPHIRTNSSLWMVQISEHTSSSPNDPHHDGSQYLLEALGIDDDDNKEHCYLDRLKDHTEAYVRKRIASVNLKRLLEDDYSLELDVALDVHKDAIGIKFSKYSLIASSNNKNNINNISTENNDNDKEQQQGLWIKGIVPGKELARALGGHEACEHGCAILSIDSREISDASELRQILVDAKENKDKKELVIICICLSKYANLDQLPRQLMRTIRRRDGKTYDPKLYKTFKDIHPPSSFLTSEPLPTEQQQTTVVSSILTTATDTKTIETKRKRRWDAQKRAAVAAFLTDTLPTVLVSSKVHVSDSDDRDENKKIESPSKANSRKRRGKKDDSELWKASVKSSKEDIISDDDDDDDNESSLAVPNDDGFDSPASATDEDGDDDVLVDDDDDGDDKEQETCSGSNEKRKTTLNIHLQRFGEFEKKLRPLVHLDYKDTKIHERTILSSMWSQHKTLLFGDTCGDNCDCISRLPELVVNVVRDHISKKKKKYNGKGKSKGKGKGEGIETEEELEGRVCGISLYFVPRFILLLKKMYPTEIQTQLITRLINMWSLHQSSRMYNGMFGVRCNEKCGCEDEWDGIFGRGDKKLVKKIHRSSYKTSSSKGLRNNSLPERRTSTSHRSIDVTNNINLVLHQDSFNKRTAPVFSQKKPNDQSQRGQNEYRTQAIPVSNNIAPKPTLFINTIVNQPFEVAFDATRPLGGYFRTEKGQNSRPKCYIFSIYAHGQLAKDARIKVGTQVIAVMIAERRKAVSSHVDIQSYYIAASRKKQKLRVLLENRHSSKTAAPRGPSASAGDSWNSKGSWIGNKYNGWTGGANCVDHRKRAHSKKKSNSNTIALPRSSMNNHDDTRNYESRQSYYGPSSSRRWQEHSTKTDNPIQLTHSTHHHAPGKGSLMDAVKNKSCNDLIDLLENGFTFNKNSFKSILQKQYHDVGKELDKIRHSSSSSHITNTNMIQRENDLEAKNKVLKLYINSTYLIEKALSLRYWTVVSFELKYLELDSGVGSSSSSSSGVVAGRSDVISGTVRTQFPVLEMGHLPVRKKSLYISYADNDHDEPSFHRSVHNNYNISLDQRRLVIEIAEGSLHDEFPPKNLGSFIFTLNEIEEKCPKDGSWIDITKRVESVGVICISAKHRSAEKEYITLKKQEILGSLKTQIELIERFNQESTSTSSLSLPSSSNNKNNTTTKLTANVRGLNGTPLLYAAIELMANKSLLQRILRMGADPRRGQGKVGSPIDLAQKQYDRCREKEQDLRNKHQQHQQQQYEQHDHDGSLSLALSTSQNQQNPGELLEAQSQVCMEAKSLLVMLLEEQTPTPTTTTTTTTTMR